MAQTVKNLPAMREKQVRSLGQEDPLEKEKATYSSIPAWRISLTEEPGRLYGPWGHKVLDMTERLTLSLSKTETSEQLEIQKNFLNLMKDIPDKPRAKITFKGETVKDFSET